MGNLNALSIANTSLLTLGIAALSGALEMAKSQNYIGAGISVIVGIILLVIYDKLPATPPTIPLTPPPVDVVHPVNKLP
jgi:hypothetical protein